MSGTDLRVRRSWHRLLGALGLLGVMAAAWLTAPAAAAPAEEVIVLPGASSAEGIAVGRGATFYAGELFGGDIFRGDLQRGTAELFIDAPPGRMAVGLKVDDASGLLFVAGGFSGQGYVYDAITGAAVATYQFGTPGVSIINDVVITQDGAWFTDSAQADALFRADQFHRDARASQRSDADRSSSRYQRRVQPQRHRRHARRAHADRGPFDQRGALHRRSGDRCECASCGGRGPDGILYEAGRLWVAQPFLNQVTRLRPNPDLTGAVVEEVITSDCFRRRRPSRSTVDGWPS